MANKKKNTTNAINSRNKKRFIANSTIKEDADNNSKLDNNADLVKSLNNLTTVLTSPNISSNNLSLQELIKNATGDVYKKYGRNRPARLGIVQSPNYSNYSGVYKLKNTAIPNSMIKTLRVKNFLIADILRTRSNVMSMMGRLRKNRLDIGLELLIKPEFKNYINSEQMPFIQERIQTATAMLINCGKTEGLCRKERLNLSTFFYTQTQNGLSFARHGTEIIYDDNNKFHRFRPIDIGTIYEPMVQQDKGTFINIRKQSSGLLERQTGDKVQPQAIERLNVNEVKWVQVDETMRPREVFTDSELIVSDLFPSSDLEHNGYPISPIETVLTSITTHMSIELYNKLYFQNGRAAKGMMVIHADDLTQQELEDIKHNYNSSINDVSNSFRLPFLGLDSTDKIQFIEMSSTKRDGEFEFLFDQTTRNILSAFNMSPDELPGFNHLSRGTNSQTLSESNNEFKLTAARDSGLRPLVLHFEDFLNIHILPLIDPELSALCIVRLSGLDAPSKQQETNNLQQAMPIHYNYDSVLEEVEKPVVGNRLGGSIPFNPLYQSIMDKYFLQNELLAELTDNPSLLLDAGLRYRRDAYFFQHIAMMGKYNLGAVKAFYATNPMLLDNFKMLIQDYLDSLEDLNINDEQGDAK